MLHNRTLNNRINNIYERALRLTYKDDQSSLKEILEKYHSVTFHHKNLPVLVTEIFKINDLAPDIMKDVSELKEPPYNLRSESNHFTRRNVIVGLSSSKKFLFICFNENPLKTMKNAFYFILKALFFLKILQFLS